MINDDGGRNYFFIFQHYLVSEGGQSFENDSRESPIALIRDYMESTEALLPSSSSSSPSVVPPEAAASPGTVDSENSAVRLLQDLEDFIQVFQSMIASFSSTSSDSSESDLQGTNWDDIDTSEWKSRAPTSMVWAIIQ